MNNNFFLVETLKSIIILKINFKNYSCIAFNNILLNLLNLISLAQKYTNTAKVEIDPRIIKIKLFLCINTINI